jgi:hypothetical protein
MLQKFHRRVPYTDIWIDRVINCTYDQQRLFYSGTVRPEDCMLQATPEDIQYLLNTTTLEDHEIPVNCR